MKPRAGWQELELRETAETKLRGEWGGLPSPLLLPARLNQCLPLARPSQEPVG